MRVIEVFEITGRGLVVLVDEHTGLPVATRLSALVVRPDGTPVRAECFKEWLLRRRTAVEETEAYLLHGLSAEEVPIGSEIRLTIAPPQDT